MNRGLYVALSGTLAQGRKLDVLTNNLANVNTPGFKKDKAMFKIAVPADSQTGQEMRDKVFVENSGTTTDFSPASQNLTGNTLDVAISGDGFFEVMTPQGVRYTRDGSFSRSKGGELVTGAGYKVMGDKGPLTIQGADVRIDKDGSVVVDGITAGKLKIVNVPKPSALKKEMDNLYSIPAGVQASPAEVEVRQGYIEGANVSVIREMTSMIDVSRSYESYIKMMQAMDEATGKVISEVGRV